MNQEIKSVLKKTVRIAGATCVAAGAVAIITSGAALKAISEGGKYLADTIKRIATEQEEPQESPAVSQEDFAAEEN